LKLAVNGDRETHNLSKSAKKKSAKQKSTREPHKNFLKHPPEERELQSGLVFEEDIDHITQFQKSKSLKQSSLRATGFVSYNNKHLAKLKNTDNKSQPDSDSDTSSDRETSTCPRPKSAQEYAQHQVTTRISHNLPPMLYHDPDFVAGDPATIDGIHTVNAVKKKGNKSANGKKSDCNEDNADESKSSISALHRQNVDADHPSRVNWRTRPKPDRITVVPFIVARTPDRVEAGVVITSRGRLHLTCFIGIDLVLTMVICW